MKEKSESFAHRIQNDHCALSFDILTDIHVTLPLYQDQLHHALEDIWHRHVKCVVVLGDLSSNGYMFQLRQCLSQLKEFPYHYMIALGNHDTYRSKYPQQVHIHPLYKELALQHHNHIFYDSYIRGFHFYVLNSERGEKSNAFYSQAQLAWLKEGLQQDTSSKPVFVCCHHPLKDTHLHSDEKEHSMGLGQEELLRILKSHPNVIFLSGHIHHSYEQCEVLVDESVFEIDVPSFRKTTYGNKKKEIGYHIQIYHDFLYLRTRDYKHNTWILSHEYILDFKTHHCYHFCAHTSPTHQ